MEVLVKVKESLRICNNKKLQDILRTSVDSELLLLALLIDFFTETLHLAVT